MAKKEMNVEETMETAKEVVMDKAEDVKAVAKETAKKVTRTAKKTAEEAKKATDAAAKAAKKEVKKLILKETYIQFAGQEYKESEILDKVEAAYKEAGHRVSSIKSIELYVKPEDGAAYYVINGKVSGKVDL